MIQAVARSAVPAAGKEYRQAPCAAASLRTRKPARQVQVQFGYVGHLASSLASAVGSHGLVASIAIASPRDFNRLPGGPATGWRGRQDARERDTAQPSPRAAFQSIPSGASASPPHRLSRVRGSTQDLSPYCGILLPTLSVFRLRPRVRGFSGHFLPSFPPRTSLLRVDASVPTPLTVSSINAPTSINR